MAGHGLIPGKNYGIGDWSQSKLRQWITQNINALLPQSVQSSDAQLETLTVSNAVTLSPAAVVSLQQQLSTEITGFVSASGALVAGTGFTVSLVGSTYTITFT